MPIIVRCLTKPMVSLTARPIQPATVSLKTRFGIRCALWVKPWITRTITALLIHYHLIKSRRLTGFQGTLNIPELTTGNALHLVRKTTGTLFKTAVRSTLRARPISLTFTTKSRSLKRSMAMEEADEELQVAQKEAVVKHQ